MNKTYILNLINNHLDEDGNLIIDKFDEFFGALDTENIQKIEEILSENNIELIYNSKIKTSDGSKPLTKYKDIKLSNEQLCLLYQKGDKEALSLLTIKNERLLYWRANKYNKRYNHKLDIDDLVQYGFLGLMKAVERFDISKGFSFTTYAVWWIDQSITRAITDYGFTIRLPVHIFEEVVKLQSIYRNNSSLDHEEIMELIKERFDYDEGKIDYLLRLSDHMINATSLYSLVGEEGDSNLIDFLEADQHYDVEKEVEEMMLTDSINHILNTLNIREQKVLRLRYGLDDNINRTLEEVGKEFEVTRERIRQIEAKALRKLRHPARAKYLRGYFSNE